MAASSLKRIAGVNIWYYSWNNLYRLNVANRISFIIVKSSQTRTSCAGLRWVSARASRRGCVYNNLFSRSVIVVYN